MSVLPNNTFISPGNPFYGSGGNTPFLSTINANTVNASTINAPLGNISTINTSTVNVIQIDLDGQILTADVNDLLLNGIPIATTANLSSIQDWAIYEAVSTVRMNNEDLSNVNNVYFQNGFGNPSLQLQANTAGSILSINGQPLTAGNAGNAQNWSQYPQGTDLNSAGYNITNVKNISSTGILGGTQVNINNTGGTAKLTTDITGTNLYVNGAVVATGGSASNWSQYPANSLVDLASNSLSNVGSFLMPTSVTSDFSLGGGSIATPIASNKQYALTTNIVNVSPLTPMEITSAGGINLTANATTGTQEFNISFVGASGNDMNITAPDINLTMTDPGSFMNLTAPGGVAILGGGGFFMASGVFEVITGLDVSLITAGNIRIGSGNVGGATTQLEKFEFLDCNVAPMNGVNHLYLTNVEISNVRRDAGGEGIFAGVFNVKCQQATTYTIQSYNSNAQQVIWQVQADEGTNVYKSMNLTSLGSNEPIRFSMSANGNTFTTTYNSGNTVSYATTGGDATLAGVGTINASVKLSAPVGSFSTLNISSVSVYRGDFVDLYVSSSKIHLGANAGSATQGNFTVAVGDGAGESGQGLNSVAVGSDAGNTNQGTNSVAIGEVAGFTSQGDNAVAIGSDAGYLSQGQNSVAVGTGAGNTNLGSNSVALGTSASANGSNFPNTIVINASGVPLNPQTSSALYINPIRLASALNVLNYDPTSSEVTYSPVENFNFSTLEISSIVGNTASFNSILGSTLAVSSVVGNTASFDSVTESSLTVSSIVGNTVSFNSILGSTLAVSSIVGNYGSFNTLRTSATNIALGLNAGLSSQQVSTVAIGANAGQISQTTFGVAIGSGAGYLNQGSWGLAIGTDAGGSNQGNGAVAIGLQVGRYGQKVNALAIGNVAGYSNQQQYTVALGLEAGQWNQAQNAVAVGWQAGQSNQGSNSVAIGYGACAVGGSFANTLVLNATGVAVNPAQASSCYIAPLRSIPTSNAYQAHIAFYNDTTKELLYEPSAFTTQVVAASATPIVLLPSARGKTYILTGSTTQNFVTATLTANDTGFFVTLRNGNTALSVGNITITGATGNLTLFNPSASQNAGTIMLYWTGSALVAY